MKITIDNKALKFLKSKGESTLAIWIKGCSSWGTGEPQPSVSMGKPQDIDEYYTYKVGDIDVYVKSDVKAKDDEITVKYTKILWTEKLSVEGILIWKKCLEKINTFLGIYNNLNTAY